MPTTFLALQHFSPLNFIDGVEGDGRHPGFAHGEGILADKVPLRVGQKDALVVHDPGIAGLAASDLLGKLAGQLLGVDIKDQDSGKGP